jgi:hypothetical protein
MSLFLLGLFIGAFLGSLVMGIIAGGGENHGKTGGIRDVEAG